MSVRASTRSYTRFTLAMDSSPGFGSTATNSSGRSLCTARPFGLGFPPAPGIAPLALLATVTRRFVLQKARDHARITPNTLSQCVGARVQDLFHSPRRGAFHHSLTVLFAIGRARYSALEGGPPCFQRDLACPAVLPGPDLSHDTFAYGALTLLAAPSSSLRLVSWFVTQSWVLPPQQSVRPTPHPQRRQALTRIWFRLLPFRSPLLREYSLFLGVLRCFSSPGASPYPMNSDMDDAALPAPGCPIRISSDHCVPAAPRGVSSRGHVLHRPQTPRHPPCAFRAVSYSWNASLVSIPPNASQR